MSEADFEFDFANWKPLTSDQFVEALWNLQLDEENDVQVDIQDLGNRDRIVYRAEVKKIGDPSFSFHGSYLAMIRDKDAVRCFKRQDVRLAN